MVVLTALDTSERITDLPYEVFDDTRLTAWGGRRRSTAAGTGSDSPTKADMAEIAPDPSTARMECLFRSERHLHRPRGINGLADGHLAVGKEHISAGHTRSRPFTFLLLFTRTQSPIIRRIGTAILTVPNLR